MTKPTIYAQHDAAFARVSAYVVMYQGEKVATIAFKHPADGAGRLYAYVHWLGLEMVRGHANGYGYDKKTAACASAAGKMQRHPDYEAATRTYRTQCLSSFVFALAQDRGPTFDSALRTAGFDVLQAV